MHYDSSYHYKQVEQHNKSFQGNSSDVIFHFSSNIPEFKNKIHTKVHDYYKKSVCAYLFGPDYNLLICDFISFLLSRK